MSTGPQPSYCILFSFTAAPKSPKIVKTAELKKEAKKATSPVKREPKTEVTQKTAPAKSPAKQAKYPEVTALYLPHHTTSTLYDLKGVSNTTS
jgi:hypothetical protein